ncbi:MAG: HAD family hydrolase [Candidatus Hodarchaeota archaeon]
MKKIVLFDLGDTLIHYYKRTEFLGTLKQSISDVKDYLSRKNLLNVSPSHIWHRAGDENYEAKNHRVRPMERRLARIFQLDTRVQSEDLLMTMCRNFMNHIFSGARYYEDTLSTLRELASSNFTLAIISNTTWGSPANLWREELGRKGLEDYIETAIFCRDVGWRKPAKRIFEFALQKLNATAQNCIFVGDNPKWDVIGARTVGIRPVLIDRQNEMSDIDERRIKNLAELWDLL